MEYCNCLASCDDAELRNEHPENRLNRTKKEEQKMHIDNSNVKENKQQHCCIRHISEYIKSMWRRTVGEKMLHVCKWCDNRAQNARCRWTYKINATPLPGKSIHSYRVYILSTAMHFAIEIRHTAFISDVCANTSWAHLYAMANSYSIAEDYAFCMILFKYPQYEYAQYYALAIAFQRQSSAQKSQLDTRSSFAFLI